MPVPGTTLLLLPTNWLCLIFFLKFKMFASSKRKLSRRIIVCLLPNSSVDSVMRFLLFRRSSSDSKWSESLWSEAWWRWWWWWCWWRWWWWFWCAIIITGDELASVLLVVRALMSIGSTDESELVDARRCSILIVTALIIIWKKNKKILLI